MPTKHYAFLTTFHNPPISLEEYVTQWKTAKAITVSAQLEKCETTGRPHIQLFAQFANQISLKRLQKQFKPAHIEPCHDSFKSYQYCIKQETRIEGPITFGPVPKPRKQKGNTSKIADFNELCRTLGPESMVTSNQLSYKDYLKVRQGINAHQAATASLNDLPSLDNEWIYGPPRVGKSRGAR